MSNLIEFKYDLDMYPGYNPRPIRLKQYSDSFSLVFKLHASKGELDIDSSTTAAIRGLKPDGNAYSNDCTIDTVSGTVTVAGDVQITAAAGEGRFEIILYNDDKELGTASFIIDVERAALDQDAIPSESVIREIYNIAETAEAIAASALDTEAYSCGTRGGVPVSSDDPAYHNNAKYYAEEAERLYDGDIDPDDLGFEQDPETFTVYPTYKGDAGVNGINLNYPDVPRNKVAADVEESLAKADSAMQPSVYDPTGYGSRTPPVDPYSYATTEANKAKTAVKTTETYTVSDNGVTEQEPTIYTGLNAAFSGVLERAERFAGALLADYSPFTILVVNELPQTGADRTFYLIPKGPSSGYEKWWYITDENNVKKWDKIGSSSTLIVSQLPSVIIDADADYIVGSGDDYQYYKYIDGAWRLIAGANAEMHTTTKVISIFDHGTPASNNIEATGSLKYYLDIDTLRIYRDEGIWGWTADQPPTFNITPSVTKNYFIQFGADTPYLHFRYDGTKFVMVGSASYSKQETDALLASMKQEIAGDISDVATDVNTLRTDVNNLGNLVKDVTINAAKTTVTITYADNSTSTFDLDNGTDVDATRFDTEDNTLRFFDSNGNELENLAVQITGGGGGGTTGGTASIGRITGPNVQSVYGDSCVINYTCAATDSGGDAVGNGTGTLYINNVAVPGGFDVFTSETGAANSIDVGEYLAVGSNTVKIAVSVDVGGESNFIATKTWTVNAINMYMVWPYADSQINTSAVTDYYTPYGALSKTIYTFIDIDPIGFNPVIVDALPDTTAQDFDPEDVTGINYFVEDNGSYTHYVWDGTEFTEADGEVLNVNTTTRSGVQQALTIPMQEHGSHTVARFMVGLVNGEEIKTAPVVHDMIFVESADDAPVIATSFNTAKMVQYNTAPIPIVVYNPSSTTSTVVLKEDGVVVSTWTGVDRTLHYWNYSPTTYGTKTLTITCGETVKTIVIEVEELDIDEAEVGGYDFRFKASEMATNAAVQAWQSSYTPAGSNVPQNVYFTFSENFDWVNGGLHAEEDEAGHLRQFFCVRAGTTVTINYPLFGTAYDPKQYGKAFKFIYKAVNCRTYDANVLTCMDTAAGNNGVGLVMTANEARLATANNSIETYYCKDSYMEFEFNIHPSSEYRYLQFWADGTPEVSKLYDAGDSMQQVNPVGITIGSPDCDVYIYMIKAYPIYLSNDNMLSNFIMDAPNAYEMVERFNRNDVLNASGEVDYQKLANANPDLHIILLDLNRMTTGKKDNVVANTFRHIYNAGGQGECFTVQNACVTVQGTSSVGYLESAGNVDVNYKSGRTFTSDNVSYTTGAIAFDDGSSSTNGYSISGNAIPVDYLNIKVNVASSENANNACIADWYNTYQPWKSPARKKNAKARDTMEFIPGVVFIRDRSGNLFGGDTTGYHLYGICDIGNSKKNTKVFHDTANPIATCVEVSNNTSLPCLMSSKTYTWNADDEATVMELVDGELKEQKVFEFRYVNDDHVDIAKDAWDRFVAFLHDHNPNLATGDALSAPVTFGAYTFKGSGSYDLSGFEGSGFLYGYGLPGYSAEDFDGWYYINYSNDKIYSSNGTAWAEGAVLTWTPDTGNVLRGTSVGTYAGTYTHDTADYRMAYLLEHCEEYMVMDPVIYHYVFIESFLMTDNVAKNTFWSSDDLVHWEPSKDYDNDTALGNDNVGGLSFTYGLETDDTVGASYVFNAHDAAWITFARGLFPACQTMYRNRESAGCFNTVNFLSKMKAWQAARPERVWVADAQRKYLRPYEDNGTTTYLAMLAGRKTHQREQVKTYNAYYYASKYVSDLCTSQNVMVRGNTPTSGDSINVVPPANTAKVSMYIDCYIVVASTSYNVVAKTKAKRGQVYTMDFSTIGAMGETELYFCTAPMITELSDLAHLYFKQNNFSMGTNLQRLEIGSGLEGYENPNIQDLTIGNLSMLEYLDVQNCPNASGALDLSGCVSLSEVYLENTNFTGISFAKGGLLEVAHLPEPTAITMRDLIYLEDLTLESADRLATLRVENCDFDSAAEVTIGEETTQQETKDIIIALINAADNLSRARLTGIDWALTDTDVLDRLLGMSGIDDDSFDITQSVLQGNAYVPIMRSGLMNTYNNAWNYLVITYDTMVTQYATTWLNGDGNPIKDIHGNNYVQWVDSGSAPYNPITMGYTISVSGDGNPASAGYSADDYSGDYYLDVTNGIIYESNGTAWDVKAYSDILTPTMESTEQYDFDFSGFDDMSAVVADKTITAQYSTTTRTYTVRFWKTPGVLHEQHTGNAYGSEVVAGSEPVRTEGEANNIYYVFKQWDKNTGFIRGNMDVYAVWDAASTFPAIGTDMDDMTVAEIYGIAQAGLQDTFFEVGDYKDIVLGHDFDFSDVDADVLGKDIILQGVPKDTFVSGGYYFDGLTAVTTDLVLFGPDSPSFTMVIDYQFRAQSSGIQNLISNHVGNTAEGFRLYLSGDDVILQWGNQTQKVGYKQYRSILVLRHPKGSNYLYAYTADGDSNSYFADEVTKKPMVRANSTQTTEPLSLGGVHYTAGYRDKGSGTIHWLKVWYADLGDDICEKLAAFPREICRMEYWGKGCYYYADQNVVSKMSFIANAAIGGVGGKGYRHQATNTNAGGWKESLIRAWLNERFFAALPTEWQSIIKAVEIKATEGSQSTSIDTVYDKVYLPSYQELSSSQLGNGYRDEIGNVYPIPWLISNADRVKFKGVIRKYGTAVTVYNCASDPAQLYQTDIEPGSLWVNTGNNSYYYIFLPQEWIDQYGLTPSYAADNNYAQGGWISSNYWWERSPYVSALTTFMYVYSTGTAGGNGNAYGANALVPGFSI